MSDGAVGCELLESPFADSEDLRGLADMEKLCELASFCFSEMGGWCLCSAGWFLCGHGARQRAKPREVEALTSA